jgi:hypothetical protein
MRRVRRQSHLARWIEATNRLQEAHRPLLEEVRRIDAAQAMVLRQPSDEAELRTKPLLFITRHVVAHAPTSCTGGATLATSP